MADLQTIYNAPLPVGFVSGTLELKRAQVYIDAASRKAQAYQKATINADRSLTDVQTGLPLRTVAAGPGDPMGGPIDWVETLIVNTLAGTPMPDPLRQTKRIPGVYTRPGLLDLHLPGTGSPGDTGDVLLPSRDPRVMPSNFSGQGIVVVELDFYADPGRPLTFGSVENLGTNRFQYRLHYADGTAAPATLIERSSREWQGPVIAVSLLPVNGQEMDWQVSAS